MGRPDKIGQKRTALFLAIPVLGLLFLLFILPYTYMATRGLRALPSLLASHSFTAIISFTLSQALLSTLLTLFLALPAAWVLSGLGGPFTRIARAFAAIPFALPPIVLVLGFILFYGNAGHLNRLLAFLLQRNEGPLAILYTKKAVIFAHAFYNFPLALLLLSARFTQIRKDFYTDALSLGANSRQSFFTLALPLALPTLFSTALLVFLYCLTSFAVVLVLGGGPGASNLAVEIYRSAKLTLNTSRAEALASLELLFALSAYLLYRWVERRPLLADSSQLQRNLPQKTSRNIFSILFLLLLLALILGPLLSLPVESVLKESPAGTKFSLRTWKEMPFLAPTLRSLLLAFLTSFTTLLLAIPAAGAIWLSKEKSRLASIISFFCFLPIISSGIVLSQAWLSFFGAQRKTSIFLIALLQATSALPFAFRAIHTALSAQGKEYPRQALSLSANPLLALLSAGLPAARAGIVEAFAFAFALSLGEFSIPLMLADEKFLTLPVWIYRASSAYRFSAACAGATVLIILSALAFAFTFSQKKEVHPVT